MCKCLLLFVLFGSSTALGDTLARDGNGKFIGFYTGVLEHGGVVLISAKGFRFVVERDTGRLRGPDNDSSEAVYFPNLGCSGEPQLGYHTSEYAGVIIPIRNESPTPYAVYYTPQSAASVFPFPRMQSRLDGGPGTGWTCTDIPMDINMRTIQLLPNDPDATGVPNTDFIPPITVTSNRIFHDGFDAASMQAATYPHSALV